MDLSFFPIGIVLHDEPNNTEVRVKTTILAQIADEAYNSLFDDLDGKDLDLDAINRIAAFLDEVQPRSLVSVRVKRHGRITYRGNHTLVQTVSMLQHYKRQGFTVYSVDRVKPSAA